MADDLRERLDQLVRLAIEIEGIYDRQAELAIEPREAAPDCNCPAERVIYEEYSHRCTEMVCPRRAQPAVEPPAALGEKREAPALTGLDVHKAYMRAHKEFLSGKGEDFWNLVAQSLQGAVGAAGAADKPVCRHTHLIKQVGPMDGGAESTRYRCKECSAFLVATQLAAPQIATSAGGKATQLDQRRK